MKGTILIIISLLVMPLYGQHKKAYQFFDAKGKKAGFTKLAKAAQRSEVVLFGELHDNPICHWLELELVQTLQKQTPLVLGAEMLERDNQKELEAYLQGQMTEKALDSLARLWDNYATDYKPLVDFAKEHQLPFIATNIPRKYASLVYKKGLQALDTLPSQEKAWIVPLPMRFDGSLSQYQKLKEMMPSHIGNDNFVKAQAIKDATMAHSIIANLRPKSVFVHFNGSYHSDFHQSIEWYLKQEQPMLKVLTISTVMQSDLSKLEKEYKGQADFILVVDEDMTKTF